MCENNDVTRMCEHYIWCNLSLLCFQDTGVPEDWAAIQVYITEQCEEILLKALSWDRKPEK